MRLPFGRKSTTPDEITAALELGRGEKLRFDVASRTDLLKSDVGHGYIHFNLPVPPYFSRNTLHYGPETYLELHRTEGSSKSPR